MDDKGKGLSQRRRVMEAKGTKMIFLHGSAMIAGIIPMDED
jgi:hypothetical protein